MNCPFLYCGVRVFRSDFKDLFSITSRSLLLFSHLLIKLKRLDRIFCFMDEEIETEKTNCALFLVVTGRILGSDCPSLNPGFVALYFHNLRQAL